jgi:hypothetical protein
MLVLAALGTVSATDERGSGEHMTRKQLERQLEAVEAQMRWAVLHHGDHELLDLLRIESSRLRVKIGQCPDLSFGRAARATADDSAATAIEEEALCRSHLSA